MKKIAVAALLLTTGMASAIASSYDELNTGIQHYNAGRWSDAIAQFDKALGDAGLSADLKFIALYDRATSRRRLGQLDAAIADYTAALALRPNEAQVLVDRSTANLRTGKIEPSGADIDRVIALRPGLTYAYGIRAIVNIRRGLVEQGRQDFRTLVKSAPESARRSQSIGIANWVVGEVDDADDIFSDQVRRGANKTYAWLWYALTQVRLGKSVPQRALPDIDPAAWPAPVINFFLGKAPQESVFAAADQGQASARSGQICEANFYVGEWMLQRHDHAAAKPLLEKAAAICPTDFIEWMPAQMDSATLK